MTIGLRLGRAAPYRGFVILKTCVTTHRSSHANHLLEFGVYAGDTSLSIPAETLAMMRKYLLSSPSKLLLASSEVLYCAWVTPACLLLIAHWVLVACLVRASKHIKAMEFAYENMRNVTTTLLVLIAALLSQPARAGTVTTTADDGPGSLRAAIADAARCLQYGSDPAAAAARPVPHRIHRPNAA